MKSKALRRILFCECNCTQCTRSYCAFLVFRSVARSIAVCAAVCTVSAVPSAVRCPFSLPKMTYKKQNLFFIGVSLHAISRFLAVFLHFYRFAAASAYKKKPRRACACRGLRFSAAAISEGLHLIEWPIHDPALPVSLWLIAVQSRPDMRPLQFLLVPL